MQSSYEAYRLFHEGQLVLAQASANGIRIDTDFLDRSIAEADQRINDLEKRLRDDDVFRLWKEEFGNKTTLGSTVQLGQVVFTKLGYTCPELTTTGRPKTDEKNLKSVDLPFVKDWLDLQGEKKARSTYLQGIRREVVDGFIHPDFPLNTARSFRSSSSSPNFQNIPVRDPVVAQQIRPCFIARKGCRIVENDFAGAEVRVSACYHQDPMMIKYIKDPTTDMHRDLASEIYLLDLDQITKMTRYSAKSYFTFAQFYGDWYVHCAKNLWEAIDNHDLKTTAGVPLKKHLKSKGVKKLGVLDPKQDPKPGTFEKHVKEIERRFWQVRFKVYADWKISWHQSYLSTGGFMMLTGFYVEGVYSKNDVVNYPIQGSSFHCLLWCLIQLQKWIDRHRMKSKIIGQIHDSIISDVPEDELQDYLNAVKWIVTVGLPKAWKWIIVPMEVEAEVTPFEGNWHRKKQWVEKNGFWQPKE